MRLIIGYERAQEHTFLLAERIALNHVRNILSNYRFYDPHADVFKYHQVMLASVECDLASARCLRHQLFVYGLVNESVHIAIDASSAAIAIAVWNARHPDYWMNTPTPILHDFSSFYAKFEAKP